MEEILSGLKIFDSSDTMTLIFSLIYKFNSLSFVVIYAFASKQTNKQKGVWCICKVLDIMKEFVNGIWQMRRGESLLSSTDLLHRTFIILTILL